MAIDFTKVIQAAAESVLDDKGSGSEGRKQGSEQSAKHGVSMPRAFLIGAGLFTAGRLIAGSRGRDMLENLQERLVDYEERHFGSENGEGYEDEEPEAEEDEDFEDEEPEAEEDEDFDEEEQPEAEEDEDFDEEEEPEAEGDEDLDDEEELDEEPPKRRRTRSGSRR